jgi:hypothetical protein
MNPNRAEIEKSNYTNDMAAITYQKGRLVRFWEARWGD